MKKLAPYIVLLILASGLAYYATLPTDTTEESEKVWLEAPKTQWKELTYSTDTLKVTITPYQSEQFWIKLVETKPATDNKPAVTEESEFLASGALKEVTDAFSPLIAKRQIGKASAEQRASYGLTDKSSRLLLSLAGGKKHDFLIGEENFGIDKYVLDQSTSDVLIVNGKFAEVLGRAKTQLFERQLTNIGLNDIDQATIKRGTSSVTWDHAMDKDKGRMVWRKGADGGKDDGSYNSWMEKVNKLRVVRMARPDEGATLDKLSELFSIEHKSQSQPKEVLIFKKAGPQEIKNDPGATPEESSYWVKTNFLGRYAKLSNTHLDSIDKDLVGLLGSP